MVTGASEREKMEREVVGRDYRQNGSKAEKNNEKGGWVLPFVGLDVEPK